MKNAVKIILVPFLVAAFCLSKPSIAATSSDPAYKHLMHAINQLIMEPMPWLVEPIHEQTFQTYQSYLKGRPDRINLATDTETAELADVGQIPSLASIAQSQIIDKIMRSVLFPYKTHFNHLVWVQEYPASTPVLALVAIEDAQDIGGSNAYQDIKQQYPEFFSYIEQQLLSSLELTYIQINGKSYPLAWVPEHLQQPIRENWTQEEITAHIIVEPVITTKLRYTEDTWGTLLRFCTQLCTYLLEHNLDPNEPTAADPSLHAIVSLLLKEAADGHEITPALSVAEAILKQVDNVELLDQQTQFHKHYMHVLQPKLIITYAEQLQQALTHNVDANISASDLLKHMRSVISSVHNLTAMLTYAKRHATDASDSESLVYKQLATDLEQALQTMQQHVVNHWSGILHMHMQTKQLFKSNTQSYMIKHFLQYINFLQQLAQDTEWVNHASSLNTLLHDANDTFEQTLLERIHHTLNLNTHFMQGRSYSQAIKPMMSALHGFYADQGILEAHHTQLERLAFKAIHKEQSQMWCF